MTNRRQNVAFSCHLATFALVVGGWLKKYKANIWIMKTHLLHLFCVFMFK